MHIFDKIWQKSSIDAKTLALILSSIDRSVSLKPTRLYVAPSNLLPMPSLVLAVIPLSNGNPFSLIGEAILLKV